MNIITISDTHGFHSQIKIPKCDVLIHAGDSTNYYNLIYNEVEFRDFLDWFSKIEARYKILIAGNHDGWATLPYLRNMLKDLGIIYLENDYVEIEGVTFFGSPITPKFGNWYFTKERENLKNFWNIDSVDIVITHGPPLGILDKNLEGVSVGDEGLLKEIKRIKPKYHIFGHIHNNKKFINSLIQRIEDTTFINASMVTDEKFNEGITNNFKQFTFNKTK